MRKRRKMHYEDERPSHERWMIAYADFITLLFAFFAALYALSLFEADKAKVEILSGSLRQAFKIIDDPIVVEGDRTRSLIEDIKENIKDMPGVSVRGEMRGVVVTFPDAVLFPSGSAEIKQDASEMLNNLAGTLNAVPGRITIEGHTDNVPLSPGARYASNWELSTARAASILHFLVLDGLKGKVIAPLTPDGYIKIGGELWQASSTETNINTGEEVVVVGINGLKCIVKSEKKAVSHST